MVIVGSDHTDTHTHTVVMTPLHEWSACRSDPLPDITQH